MPFVAGDLRSGEAELVAQDLGEARPDRHVEDVLATVHREPQIAHEEVTATVSAI